jgi:hypothetical protein
MQRSVAKRRIGALFLSFLRFARPVTHADAEGTVVPAA